MCKRTASIFLTFVILISFLSTATAQEPEPIEPPPVPVPIIAPPTEPLPPEELLEIHTLFHGEVVNSHDADAVASFFAEDGVFDYVPAPPPAEGREAISAFFEAVYQAFPDWQCCPDGYRRNLISGNVIATECYTIGTHGGDWAGIPATGNSIQTIHLDIYDFEGSEIKRLTTYDDSVSVLVQMGAMPASELPELVPSFQLPAPDPPALSPVEAAENGMAVWNTHDLVSYAKLFHPDAEILLAPLGTPMDLSAFIASQELYFLGFSDLREETVRIVDMGDGWVLVELVFIGTNDGPYFGLPATGNHFETRSALLARYDTDGLATNLNVYWDELTTLTQLGLFPPPPSETEANKAIHRRSFEEIWNQGNLDVVDEILAADGTLYVPPDSEYTGREAYKQAVTIYRTAWPDLNFVVEDQIAEGDLVASRWTGTGTNQAEFMGIPPTGEPGTTVGISINRIVDGKVVEDRAYPNNLGLMQQLRVLEVTGNEIYAWGASSDVTGDPGDPQTNKALVTRVVDEFWNQKNPDALDETHSADAIAHNPVIADPLPYEGYKQVCLAYITAIPDMHVATNDLFAEGDKVVIRWTVTGTHQTELMGIPASGNQVTFTGITIYRIADGKIVENWWAYDALGFMQQLTAEPPKYEVYALMVSMFEDGGGIFRFADESRPDVYAKNREDAPVNCIYIKGPGVELVYGPGMGKEAAEMMGMPYYGHEEMLSKIGVSLDQINYVVIDHTCFDHPGGVDLFPNATVIVQKALFDQPNPLIFPMPDGSMFPLALEQDYAKLEKTREEGRLLVVEGDYEIAPGLMTHHAPGHTYETNFLTIDTEDGTVVAAGDNCYTYLNLKYGILPIEGLVVDSEAMLQGYEKIRQVIGGSDALLVPGHEMDVYKRYTQVADRVVKIELPEGDFTNVFFTQLDPGLNMISLPLKPMFQHDARSFAEMLRATMVVRYDSDIGDFVAFIPYAPDDGFPIEGGQGYIVNVPKAAVIPFTGAAWTNNPPFEMAPPVQRTSAWAFVVGGWVLDGEGMSASDGGYTVTVKNLRTGALADENVGESGYFAVAYADLRRKAVVEAGDKVEVAVIDSSGKVVSGPFVHDITLDGIRDAVVKVQLRLGDIIPEKSALLQNYPNPFNPETWIPFHLKGEASVSIRIFNLSGQLVKTLDLGHRDAGVYVSRTKAAYWDGKNEAGEKVSSGIYFYSISAGDFSSTKKMIIRK